jgi:Tol biopolymer transport system component
MSVWQLFTPQPAAGGNGGRARLAASFRRSKDGTNVEGSAWGALAWSPNGGSIVYDTGGYKNTNLYAIGIDGRHKVRLTNTPGIDIAPSGTAR